MATIKDIAALSRVSTATVSHVINGSSKVSPELRERVLQVIRELKYHPNAIARGLKTRQTKTVGMIVPDITNPFFPGVIRGAEDALRDAGYSLIFGNSDSDLSKEESYYRTFRAQRVDGLLLIACVSAKIPEYLLHHDLKETPLVFVDRFYQGLGADVVISDNVNGTLQGVNHLFDMGHERIGMITGPLELVNARMRLEGYKRALAAHHVYVRNELIREGQFNAESGYEQAKELLRLKDRPTAIFVSNGPMTLGCLRAMRECGVKSPADLAIISFDDLVWFEFANPTVSAVGQDDYGLGAKAARMLARRLSGELTGPARRKVVKTTLLVRESSHGRVAAVKQGFD